MAQENDPTQKFLEATERYQTILTRLWKVVFKKVASIMRALTSFLTKFIAQAKDLVTTIGKKAVNTLIGTGQRLIDLIQGTPNRLKAAIRFGKKIVALIKKAVDPNKIINTLKKLFRRYVQMIQDIANFVSELISNLDIIGTALGVVNTFKRVLQMMFAWIADVTRANDAALKAKRMLKKVQKDMKREVKEAIKLRREVMKLKVAA